MEENKKRQHYVWRHYLTAWENENQKLYCLRDNKIYLSSARGVAHIRYFYRLNELSSFDIQVITKMFIDDFGPVETQEINKNWIVQFNQIFELKRSLEQKGLASKEVNEQIDVLINNIEENLHKKIEDTGIPYLELLRNGDISFYQTTKGKADFNYFICTQYFRTNMIKNSVLRSVNTIPVPPPPGFDAKKIINVLTHIWATNTSFQMSLPKKSFNCLILKNNTPTPFITGDQPVINTKADYNNEEPTDELELYYPISAKIALLISQSPKKRTTSIDIEENEVQKYNNLIFQASEEQVYANESAVLNRFKVADAEQYTAEN